MMVILQRLWIQVTADRKRFGVLCAMVCFGMLLWARVIVTSNLPRTAVADDEASSVNQNEGGDTTGPSADKHLAEPIQIELSHFPARDPFAISAQHFPKPTSVMELEQHHAKSGAEAVEDAEIRLTARLRSLVDGFTLDAVMQGRPMAVINQRTYQLNDRIESIEDSQVQFELIEVLQRSVILECEGRRFELLMEMPGGIGTDDGSGRSTSDHEREHDHPE